MPRDLIEKPAAAAFIFILLTFHLSAFTCPAAGAGEQRLKLATTTSTENTGLLKVLLPPFENKYGVHVDVIAVGTGKALKLGENGDVDVVLVHAKADELKFVEARFGVDRREIMYNEFQIAGPKSDPAKIKGMKDAGDAFKKIARSQSVFVSRGDNSGTHVKEKEIWAKAGAKTKGKWYVEAGQGMEQTLQIASEKLGYTLTDSATFLAYEDKIELVILMEGDPILYNLYGIIAVNPKKYPQANYRMAENLIEWISGPEARAIIEGFKIKGKVLFHPL
ncbi:MAG: substrate-binding domain-containing protein [bacterium]|nr:substrate-binding domain-containing protein [bacterium]